MKNGLRSILVLVLAVITYVNSAASVTPDLVIRSAGSKSIVLSMSNQFNESIEVSVINEQGRTLHNDKFEEDKAISRKYDLSKLPHGFYTLKIVQDQKTFIQTFSITDIDILLPAEGPITVFKPSIRVNGRNLDIDLFCEENTDINLMIEELNGEKIYTNSITKKGAVQKRFNLSKLDRGTYVFRMRLNVNGEALEYSKTFVQ